jgi:hypothetical protein
MAFVLNCTAGEIPTGKKKNSFAIDHACGWRLVNGL